MGWAILRPGIGEAPILNNGVLALNWKLLPLFVLLLAPNWKLGVELPPLPLDGLLAPKTKEPPPLPLPLLVLPKLKVLPPLPVPLLVLPKLKEPPPPTDELLDRFEAELFKPPNPTVLLLLLLPKTGVVAFILLV